MGGKGSGRRKGSAGGNRGGGIKPGHGRAAANKKAKTLKLKPLAPHNSKGEVMSKPSMKDFTSKRKNQ